MECAKIQIAIKQYGNRGGSSFMTYMGVNDFVFDKMNVEKWKDIPNRYQPNDVCVIDGESSKFYVNGMYRPNVKYWGVNILKLILVKQKFNLLLVNGLKQNRQ